VDSQSQAAQGLHYLLECLLCLHVGRFRRVLQPFSDGMETRQLEASTAHYRMSRGCRWPEVTDGEGKRSARLELQVGAI
jgi:hypothetical protein